MRYSRRCQRYAIFSKLEAPHWRCNWFANCNLQRRPLPRYLEASQPDVTEGHVLIPAYEEGGFTWMSMAFDHRTLALRAGGLCAEGGVPFAC